MISIYAQGFFVVSVCAPQHMTPDDVALEVERTSPSGTTNGWQPSSDETFSDGTPNPCPCDQEPGRRHHLLEA